MNTKVNPKKGNVKSIAKKSSNGKKQPKPLIISVPKKLSVKLPDLNSQEKTESTKTFPENYLPIEKTDESTDNSPHFFNKATDNQKEYVKNLIENRMKREGIQFKHLVSSLAELFGYDTLKAYWASTSITSLLKALYKDPAILNQVQVHDRKRVIETLENISQFLDFLHSIDNYKVMFDLLKVEDKYSLNFSEVVDLQRRHAERQIVDDGVFAFDLAFEVPFNKLSEEAKVDRLKLYLKEHTGWTDEPFVLPEHVKKYLPKAQEMLQAEQEAS